MNTPPSPSLPPDVVGLPPWFAELLVSDDGKIRRLSLNAKIALTKDPAMAGKVRYNAFSDELTIRGVLPWAPHYAHPRPWQDGDLTQATWWLQNQGILVSRQVAFEVIKEIARERAYHPVIDVFRNLGWPTNSIWDREPRIETWLSKYLGVQNNAETRALGVAWLMSMVQRILDPGCRVPGVLVLAGNVPGKREALRILAGDFYAVDIETSAHSIKGAWVAEIDLDQVRSLAEIRGLKTFLARRSDRKISRQCIFAALTRHSAWPEKVAGSGWWPMRCGRIDLDGLEHDRDQLIAECLVRYRAGEFRKTDSLAIEAASSTIRRYLNEQCEIHPSYAIEKDVLHEDYTEWCKAQGLPPENQHWFGRRLRAVLPGQVANYRPHASEGHRPQMFKGLRPR